MKTYHLFERPVTPNLRDPRSKAEESEQPFRLEPPIIPITTQPLQGEGNLVRLWDVRSPMRIVLTFRAVEEIKIASSSAPAVIAHVLHEIPPLERGCTSERPSEGVSLQRIFQPLRESSTRLCFARSLIRLSISTYEFERDERDQHQCPDGYPNSSYFSKSLPPHCSNVPLWVPLESSPPRPFSLRRMRGDLEIPPHLSRCRLAGCRKERGTQPIHDEIRTMVNPIVTLNKG